jgi:uncharacterized protein YbjT (DUF2867 family)
MILVTGAGGNTGGALARSLAASGIPFRAAFHREEQAARSRSEGLDAVVLDLERPETLRPALSGMEKLFLVCPPSPRLAAMEAGLVDESVRAGVRHLVKVSVWRASERAYSLAAWHRSAEERIEASGVGWTFLRPNSFMQNFVTYLRESIRTQGAFHLPAGAARVSHIDTRDIGEVAARVLTTPGHQGRAYDLSGPEALSYAQVAHILSVCLERKIAYVDVGEPEFRAALAGAGSPDWWTEAMLDLQRYSRDGNSADVLGSVASLLGRRPIPFERFARDHREAFH